VNIDEALRDLLQAQHPDSILYWGSEEARPIGDYRAAHPACRYRRLATGADGSADFHELGRFDVALLWHGLGLVPREAATATIGRLRTFHAGRLYALLEPGSDWSARDFYALAMVHHASAQTPRGEAEIFRYDLDSYTRVRSWNNPKNWANPENFRRYRW
jgi:hypothetical protein